MNRRLKAQPVEAGLVKPMGDRRQRYLAYAVGKLWEKLPPTELLTAAIGKPQNRLVRAGFRLLMRFAAIRESEFKSQGSGA